MRFVLAAACAASLFIVPVASAQTAPGSASQTQPGAPAQTQPGAPPQTQPGAPAQTQPPAPGQTQPGTTAPAPAAGQAAAPGTPTAIPARAFTANAGLIFNTVKPDKTADFEKVIAALQSALEASTDPTVQAQARGWQVFRAMEAGPNNTVLYVFVLDPAVPGADYGLGSIFRAFFTDPAELQDIWKLYTGSVTGGGTLLNLLPVGAAAEQPTTTTNPLTEPAPEPKMLPPDADPNRR